MLRFQTIWILMWVNCKKVHNTIFCQDYVSLFCHYRSYWKWSISVWRFDVDVPGGMVYKESSFTEAGKFLICFNIYGWSYWIDFRYFGVCNCFHNTFYNFYLFLNIHADPQKWENFSHFLVNYMLLPFLISLVWWFHKPKWLSLLTCIH